MKPGHVAGKSGKQLKILDLDNKEQFMKEKYMYVGGSIEKIRKASENHDEDVKIFRNQASIAYVPCAKHLQKTMPLTSNLLRSISCTDPKLRGHS